MTAARSRGHQIHRMRVATIAVAAIAAAILMVPTGAGAKTLGQWTQADVNESIERGVAYLMTKQNEDGSFGTTYPVAETTTAITSFGVLDGGHYAKLTSAQQAALKKAVAFLLEQQQPGGEWFAAFGEEPTYGTGLALLALSFSSEVPTTEAGAITKAIEKGRAYLIGEQQTGNGETECQTTGENGTGKGGQYYCGGWNYNPGGQRSDESNTGFAITGLASSGGVPAAVAKLNEGWQRNVQEFSGNLFPALRNDGGAGYQPAESYQPFSSNANDSGTNLFSFGFDGVPGSDPAVQASIKFDGDVLSAYELEKEHLLKESGTEPLNKMTMIYHEGATEDGACTPDEAACDWKTAAFEGGFHYSMFSITKGFSQYAPAELTNPANYYAKVVDLLLEQQHGEGSEAGAWPEDPRDDPTPVMATGFAILALGRVGAPAQISGTVYSDVHDNGVLEAGDSGLGGWTVFVDVNGSGLPAGQPQAVTAADGTYSIQNIPEGTYPVRVVGQSGYTCTQPTGCAYSEHFTLDANITGLDFGEFKPTEKVASTPTTKPSPTPTPTPTPKSGVLAFGSAHLASSARACVASSSYLASVSGNDIASVTFTLNGHKLKTLTKAGSHGTFSLRVPVKAGKVEHLAMHVTFTSATSNRSQTINKTLARCAAVHHASTPRFTG